LISAKTHKEGEFHCKKPKIIFICISLNILCSSRLDRARG